MNLLVERYSAVFERLVQAAQRANRNPAAITLVAVTKTWPAETVLQAYDAGMRHFGENRPEELAEKRQAVEAVLGLDSGITWHLIGTLQSRKTDLAATYADTFHALDRLKIANRLAQQLQENGRILPTFLEVNISGEESKSGWACQEWETNLRQQQTLQEAITAVSHLPGLNLQGLMTMAPWNVPSPEIRAVFRRTRHLLEWLNTAVSTPLTVLSMGMTDDFEIAIEEGATHVRVGRAIFGTK